MQKYFNELLCPNCDEPLDESRLQKKLACPKCRVNLKSAKFKDFLEYLIAQGIVENIDFFDAKLYGEDFLRYETSELDEQDIADTENPKDPTGMKSGNILSVEEEFIKEIEENSERNSRDFAVFDPEDDVDTDEEDK
ncbi:MAG: hypothetical protein KAI81_00130 [Candidatus Marinimicrobia bacterium]|nr:hypothetical protein [Candidatus Neomarinimicrobiota bacterium]